MHGGWRETRPEDLSARALRAWLDFAEEAVAPAARDTAEGAGPPTDAADAEVDTEVDAVIAEFGGDVRAALRALLHDIAVLAGDFATVVSRGYVRGYVRGARTRTGRGRSGAAGPSR